MESRLKNKIGNHSPAGSSIIRPAQRYLCAPLALVASALLIAPIAAKAAQSLDPTANPALPNAPQPKSAAHPKPPKPGPCQASRSVETSAEAAAVGAANAAANTAAGLNPQSAVQPAPCPPLTPIINWYARFLNGPQVKPLTPKEKALFAARNVIDPFNAITILGSSAIAVGSDADSPYGPGMRGFGKYVGVSYTQDITAEFFGTFLIPSIVHQDPHYHRMPNAPIPRRFGHALLQVLWTQGDDGKGMPNYANLAGFAIAGEIGNLYVPGRATNLPASAERYGIDLATAPIDNFITEFLPDVASHIHVRVVLIQRIINQVAKAEATTQP